MVDPRANAGAAPVRILTAVLLALACVIAQAASAPFVQIAGPAGGLAGTCPSSAQAAGIRLNLEVPAGASWNYSVGYVMPDTDDMYMMDMMMMGMTGGDVLLVASTPQNGPLAADDAAVNIGNAMAWFGPGARLMTQELVVLASAYSGPNGTGQIVAQSRMSWMCDNGAPTSRSDAYNSFGAIPAEAQKLQAFEYYNAALDHYFMTANPDEIASLDSGKTPGWTRTGMSFGVFAGPASGTSPVCRDYMPPGYGDSHFYSASPAECADVAARFPSFVVESSAVFYIARPDTTTGACPSLTVPVYRLWNNRADSNHRYTTDPAVAAQMVARGYIAEGYGPKAVIMCAAS